MEKDKINRLNMLFEKVVSSDATALEERELKALYQQFIDEGRDCLQNVVSTHQYRHRHVG